MHTHDLSAWTRHHLFDEGNHAVERGKRAVMWITAAMMIVEIAAGLWFNSMALLAVWAKNLLAETGKVLLDRVREQLAQHEEIVHATVEIQRCH